MERKIYYNRLPIIMIPVSFLVPSILVFFILLPAMNNPDWIVWGTIILTGLTFSIWFSHMLPFILILRGDVAIFIGFPWVTRIKREKLENVIIRIYCFFFIPKVKTDYRFVSKFTKGKYKGYKFIFFRNLEAWGELIVFLKPTNPDVAINWNALNDRERKYIIDKL